MKIWYDSFTGKHIRYGVAVAERFRRLGHEVILTTRVHPDTVGLAKVLKEEFVLIGGYDPTSLFTRLRASLKRMLELSDLFKNDVPDVAVSHQSVDLCRVALGLGIPIILTADTAHATVVNRLTLPLANVVVASEALPRSFFKNCGAQNVLRFKGVDEVAWIKGFSPSREAFDYKRPLIVVRQMETKASYALGKADVTKKIAQGLSAFGTVLFLSRYDKREPDGLVVVKEFVDSASLVAHADLVVSAGGTISREAALQGVPSIVVSEFGRIYVNDYLSRKGFPMFTTSSRNALKLAKEHLGERWNVKRKLAALEDPVDTIERIVTARKFA